MANKITWNTDGAASGVSVSAALALMISIVAGIWWLITGGESVALIIMLLLIQTTYVMSRKLYMAVCFAKLQKVLFARLLIEFVLAAILSTVLMYFLYQQPLEPKFKDAAIEVAAFVLYAAFTGAVLMTQVEENEEYSAETLNLDNDLIYATMKFKLMSSIVFLGVGWLIYMAIKHLLLAG